MIANGIFAGAEIAVVALRKTRVDELAEQGKSGALAVLALRNNPERFLATVQVGITVVGATAAAFGGEVIARRIAQQLEHIGWLSDRAEGVALALVVALISYLSIVVGELVPKSLALRGAEQYALLVARPLLALSWFARPLVWIMASSANVVLKPFGDSTTFTETRLSAEELQELVEEATKAGTIHPEAGEIAARALELPDLTAADVMVPRRDVVAIARDLSADALRSEVVALRHSRIPVYEGLLDNVVGYVNVKDLLVQALEGKPLALESAMRSAYFVPESVQAMELLKQLRNEHVPLAIVVDEQGGTSGIVTLEDLVEELVGKIFNERVEEVPQLIKRTGDGAAIVSGAAHVRDVNRELGIELPEDGEWTTVAGLCLAHSGRIPSAGEIVDVGKGIRLEIVEASPRRIRSVRVPASQAAN